ncbi:MAG: DUF1194 domain-containing protein [Proteobacteria bacterium]|nr:DUF1194 domain-containing protein [Pseudomonadota bacterium]
MRHLVQTALLGLALSASILSGAARAADKVDLLLVLASDVSRSVTPEKFKLQRDGYAAAIANPRVLDAIKGGRNGRIAVMFLEWSGMSSQKVVIDWTMIDGQQSAHAFGTRLLEEPRAFGDRTSISGGIEAAMAQLDKAPYESERQTIDVSGDGTNNSGRDVVAVRDEALNRGIVINGLVILSDTPMPWNPEHTNPPGGLAKYYRDNVTGGPGSFVMEAQNFESFGDAILKKMIAEIADAGDGRAFR